MIIAGTEIDFNKVIETASSSVMSDLESSPFKYDDNSRLMDSMDLIMRCNVWKVIAETLEPSTSASTEYNAEAVLAEAMRNGVKQSQIRFRKNCFLVTMKNTCFKIRKQEHGYSAAPETLGGYRLTEMGWCDPELFARLIQDFDDIVPIIDSASAGVVKRINDFLLKEKQEKMARELQEMAVNALAETYLTPLGITCSASFDGDKVSLSLELRKSGEIETTMDKLPEILADTEAVIKLLKPTDREQRKLKLRRYFH